jgi:hypothetical protein
LLGFIASYPWHGGNVSSGLKFLQVEIYIQPAKERARGPVSHFLLLKLMPLHAFTKPAPESLPLRREKEGRGGEGRKKKPKREKDSAATLTKQSASLFPHLLLPFLDVKQPL